LKHRKSITTAIISAFCASALAASNLPEGITQSNGIFLPGSSEGASAHALPRITGGLVESDAMTVWRNHKDMVVLRTEGHQGISATFRYSIDSDVVTPGIYSFWADCHQGGKAEQNFGVSTGNDASSAVEQLSFSETPESWQRQWRQAGGFLHIFPEDKVIEVELSGMATGQKNVGGFILEKIDDLPKGFQQGDFQARHAALKRFKNREAPAMLVAVSAVDDPRALTPFFRALNQSAGLETLYEIVHASGEHAAGIRKELGLTSKAWVIGIQPNLAVTGMWQAPDSMPAAKDLVDALKKPEARTPIPPGSLSAQVGNVVSLPMENGRPRAWLTVGFWAGPAGLSLWGMDYEPHIRPNEGDPCIVTQFDRVYERAWTAEPLLQSQRAYGNFSIPINSIWPKGTSYAHVYVYSPEARNVQLHSAQTGILTAGWCNGDSLAFRRDRSARMVSISHLQNAKDDNLGMTDQGDAATVHRQRQETPRVAALDLKQGWNRILLKFIHQSQEGETFAFDTLFTNSDGTIPDLKTSLSNPDPSKISRTIAGRLIPLVFTNAPFNLVHDGAPLAININLGGVNYAMPIKNHGFSQRRNSTLPVLPFLPFEGQLKLAVHDYDGKEIYSATKKATFPDTVAFDLGEAPRRGYYYTHLELLDNDGNLVAFYPPDGFSVIGGVAAQRERRDAKEMAVVYYFMSKHNLYDTLYFPYMQRIGIFRNIGGCNGRALEMYKTARENGLILTADLWNRTGEYLQEYVKETAPFVDSYKSHNEIDIHPDQRGTPESWVAKAKTHYETAKKHDPDALVVGASFARPGADEWFTECLKLGLGNFHDVWDVHCYPQHPPVLGGSMSNSPRETESGVLMAMESIGMTNTKPFWIGETGARCSHGSDARPWQADTVAKMAACSLSRKDFEIIGFLVPWHYARAIHGISDISAAHMPAETAYYTASALIDGFESYQRINLGDDIQAARFGPTLMLWRTNPAPTDIQFQADLREPLVLVDVVGRVNDLPVQEDGSVIVKVSESPVYLLNRGDYETLTSHGTGEEPAVQ
jgi:hypothetical protein